MASQRKMSVLQDEVVREAEVGAARKVFDLSLTELGPYSVNFTRSGRFLALGGRKGHLAVMDWQRGKLITEIQVFLCTSCRGQQGMHMEGPVSSRQLDWQGLGGMAGNLICTKSCHVPCSGPLLHLRCQGPQVSESLSAHSGIWREFLAQGDVRMGMPAC